MASKDELRQSLKDYHGTWIKVRRLLPPCSSTCLLNADRCISLQLSTLDLSDVCTDVCTDLAAGMQQHRYCHC
jgi:hypothetical protein